MGLGLPAAWRARRSDDDDDDEGKVSGTTLSALTIAATRFVATRKPIAEVLERWEPCCFPIVLLIGLGIVILVEGGAFGL